MKMLMFVGIVTTNTKSPKATHHEQKLWQSSSCVLPPLVGLSGPALASSTPLLLSFSGETRRGRRRHEKQAAEAKSSLWREASWSGKGRFQVTLSSSSRKSVGPSAPLNR